MDRYTLNVYIAAPGTPLAGDKDATSLPGHMYYAISDGKDLRSYGFAPVTPGDINGPGTVYRGDVDHYINPRYMRTMEISEDQYKALHAFGEKPTSNGFSLEYRDARNNCVDFTWSALNSAGIHRTINDKVDKTHEGSLKPLRNIDDVQSIPDPVKDSPLNREHFNPLPPRTLLQKWLSEQTQQSEGTEIAQSSLRPSDPGHPDHGLYRSIANGVSALDAERGRSFDGISEQLAGSLTALAKEQQLDRVDHVVLSQAREGRPSGETVFIVQGRLDDPAMRQAHMATATAVSTPLETSWQRVEKADAHHRAAAIAQQQRQPESAAPEMARAMEA